MKTFTIRTSQWDRGHLSFLWSKDKDSHECGCVLGHYAHQVEKVPLENLIDRASPRYIPNAPKVLFDEGDTTDFACDALSINDSYGMTDEQRMEQLIEHFKEIGVELNFEIDSEISTGKY